VFYNVILLQTVTITCSFYSYLQLLPLLTTLLLRLSATVSIIFSLPLFNTATINYHRCPYLQLLQLLTVNTLIYNPHHYLYLTIIYYCYNYMQNLHTGRSLTENTLPDAVLILFHVLMISTELLEACRGL
jgi:hypothetical protein